MDKKYNVIKEKLFENKDKRVLVLGTTALNFETINRSIKIGKLYDKVYDELLIQNYGFIDPRYISDSEKKRIEDCIKIEKGTPLFSHKIISSDIIIFIYVNPQVLRILCTLERVSYNDALNLQNILKNQLRKLSCKVININLYPNIIDIDTIGRNVYICDDNNYDLIDRKDIKESYEYEDVDYYFRFPYIKTVKSIEDLKRKQGFLLIINEEYLNSLNYIEIDKKYRTLFNHFNLVYIVTKNKLKNDLFHLKYSNIYFVNESFFQDDILQDIYFDYILNFKETKFSKKKLLLLNEINTYLKNKKTVKTDELVDTFNLYPRKVERYMNDINKLYKNIGYDYMKNEWYIIK